MHYQSGERTFIVDTKEFRKSDKKDYLSVIDKDTNAKFILPKFVIEDFKYIFSWDRYHEDLDKDKLIVSLTKELDRLLSLEPQPNILIGIDHMREFISS